MTRKGKEASISKQLRPHYPHTRIQKSIVDKVAEIRTRDFSRTYPENYSNNSLLGPYSVAQY